MGAIQRAGAASREVEYLYQDHTVGRSSSSHLVLARPVISGHHAAIRYSRGVWTLRDLGSRNGTFLNGRRLTSESGDSDAELADGDQIMFADEDEVWEVVDTQPPQAMLLPLEPGRDPVLLDEHDMLALPSAESPLVTIFHQHGRWQIERDGDCLSLDDRQQVIVGELGYRAMITGTLEATQEARSRPVLQRVDDLRLDIRVARDEESAAVRARLGPVEHELPQRAHFYLLAFLARQRLAEAARGADAGWVDVDSACTELGLASVEALSLQVFRCRQAIKECGVEDPAAIIDRARRRQLRIGVEPARLSVGELN